MEILLNGTFLALLGTAIAAGISGYGSAKGIGIAGEAATGILAEDPSRFGQTLLLQAIPSTQGIYGLLVAFIVWNKIGVFGSVLDLTAAQGLQMFAACLPVAITGFTSAIAQGRICAAAMNIIAKRPEETSKGMIYASMSETYAVFGLLASFLMVNGINI